EGDSVETVSYAYDSGRLTQVTYADGSSIRYTWNGNQITGICGVEDSQGAQEHLFIGYPDGASSGQQKVSALTYCSGGAEVSGLDFAYGPSWCILTDHADTESGIPRQTTYRFNPYGNTVAAANSAGQWASAAYEKDADSEAPANRLSAATRLQESLTGLSPILLQTEDEQLDLQNAENLVNNGDFEETPGAEWVRKSLSSSDKVVTSAGNRGRCALKAFKLTGTSGATRGLVQTLAISGDADDTITFGGWFLYQGPVIKDSRRAGLKVQLYYNSTSRGIVYVNVDPSDGGWQYISGSIVPTGGTRKFNKVVITLVNSAAGSTLLCDGIQMEERECNYRYTYNDEGDITSVKSPTGKTTTYSYSSGNLTCIDPPGSGAFHFTYSYNRLTKITTPTGIETTYTNDSNGNRLEKTVRPSSRSLALTEEYTYSDSGNMRESITTADRSTISYVNDEDALRVNAVIDPMGSRTEYTYDAMGRVIKTAQQGVSVETVYDGDRMTGLCRGSEAASMEYGFSYGPGGLESVRAAGRTLTENEYS
ncbi:MAG: hypothetical protein HUJ80_00865, partial [Firmicutes bacterium]|nr:hypothetical protein [Bacillota bacterium]